MRPGVAAVVAKRSTMLVVVWAAFLLDLMVGAGLLLSDKPSFFIAGVALVLAACLGMAGVTLYYYLQQRRASTTRPSPEPTDAHR